MDYYKLLNKNVIKIIEVLVSDKLYFNQIHELTKIKSKNNLLKNLELMVKMNILKREKNKSNTYYRINYDNQFSLALLQLTNINKLQNLPFERRKAILEVISNTKPVMSVLFGSTAKGNFKQNSDIDILLINNQKNKTNIQEIRNIESRYGVKVNAITLKFSDINLQDSTIKHIFKTGYPVTGYNYFYEVLKNV